ncbi:KGGVGR-motif variant AAA ATPase [Terasakiella pusilla]|uniref:KGGVGR-motif variant AAA ATPase n=1 Tax=Terasakiella pusilla TaxID=64973 RepID=UPI003AA82F29
MYVVTFYSFKGGVGRSQALVETAAQLSLAGKKVLVVDFDLEAPGLDMMLDARPNKGVVEFVHEFKEKCQTPNIAEFVRTIDVPGDEENIEILLMSAGLADNDYGGKLESIDWQDLYQNWDGYLLMEDMRAQWEKVFKPDYVLIDSRTGHTDSSGICTRQLPDALVAMGFPNKQNLMGLAGVVFGVRKEGGRNNSGINIHLALSRIPLCDDEKGILNDMFLDFSNETGCEYLTEIHHYDSMDLLDNSIFSIKRPNSRLAKEYTDLVEDIRSRNIRDREGVLQRIHWNIDSPPVEELSKNLKAARIVEKHIVRSMDREDLEWLDSLWKFYQDDDEVLFFAGLWLFNSQQRHRAQEYLERSFELDEKQRAWYILAPLYRTSGDLARASEMVYSGLNHVNQHPHMIRAGIQILVESNADLARLEHSQAIISMSEADRQDIFFTLEKNEKFVEIIKLFAPRIDPEEIVEENWDQFLVNEYLVPLLSGRMAKFAKSLAEKIAMYEADENIPFWFNYGIADWAATGKPNRFIFEKVTYFEDVDDPNHSQCFAILAWVLGDTELALQYLHMSRDLLVQSPSKRVLSAWRFLDVSREEFLSDLDAMEIALHEEPAEQPLVVSECMKLSD